MDNERSRVEILRKERRESNKRCQVNKTDFSPIEEVIEFIKDVEAKECDQSKLPIPKKSPLQVL